MTTSRREKLEWLEYGIEKWPHGFEADIVNAYGMEGALGLLAAQEGDAFNVNLVRRPFAGNEELKAAVVEARAAQSKLEKLAYEVWWVESDRIKDKKEGTLNRKKEASDGESEES